MVTRARAYCRLTCLVAQPVHRPDCAARPDAKALPQHLQHTLRKSGGAAHTLGRRKSGSARGSQAHEFVRNLAAHAPASVSVSVSVRFSLYHLCFAVAIPQVGTTSFSEMNQCSAFIFSLFFSLCFDRHRIDGHACILEKFRVGFRATELSSASIENTSATVIQSESNQQT